MQEKSPVKVVALELTEPISLLLRRSPNEIVHALRLAAGIQWYQRGVIPQEKACEIAGVEQDDFILAMRQYQH